MTSQSEKRGAISARRRRSLLLFVTELEKLKPQFSSIRLDIEETIEDFVRQAARTREADRQDVLNSLTNWLGVGSSVDDLVEDTGLSERIVRGVLDELMQADPALVTVRERPGERGRPAKVYDLASV